MRSPSARVLINRVDAYKASSGRDADGGVVEPYPARPTFAAVPSAQVQPQSVMEVEDQQRITKITEYKILFGSYLGLNPRDKIVWIDPQGVTHLIYVKADRDEAGRQSTFTLLCEERIQLMAQDLLDAVIATLENSAAFTAAFGDAWNQAAQTGVAKVFADFSDQVALPYAILTEVGEGYQYMSAVQGGQVSYLASGQMQCDIWAPGRYQTRVLGQVIAKALDDAPLVWPLDSTMEFRLMRSQSIPMPGQSGAGVPIVFHRVFTFEYMYSGVM